MVPTNPTSACSPSCGFGIKSSFFEDVVSNAFMSLEQHRTTELVMPRANRRMKHKTHKAAEARNALGNVVNIPPQFCLP